MSATETTAGLAWRASEEPDLSLGIEEEGMLLEPDGGAIAHRTREVMPRLRERTGEHVSAETHDSAFELATGVHRSVAAAARELRRLRGRVAAELPELGYRAAVAGTHPTAIWQEIEISDEKRYEQVHDSMRELARREPTFALHIHIGVADPDAAIKLLDRMRVHLPMLLGLSGNSPFWQGRDSGLASARIPLFQSFPRVGIPRSFGDYEGWVRAIAPLIESGAVADPSFLWWDIRPKPELGTVEVRIMDAQTDVDDAAALVAFTLALVKLELDSGWAADEAIDCQEVIDENRFLAARDGVDAELIDAVGRRRRPLRELAAELLGHCADPAAELGCAAELEGVERLLREPPARRQRAAAGEPPDFERLLGALAAAYTG